MSTVDTRLSNLNIWEGTTAQLDGVEVGVNDMVFVTDVEFEEKFRYTSMPEASDHIGEIVQYIGLTNETYTQGSYYKSVFANTHIDEDSYSVLSGQTVYISDMDKLNAYLATSSNISYMTLTQYGDRSDAYGFLRKYDENDTYINGEGCFWSWMTTYYGISVSGPQYFDSTVYVKFIPEGARWVMLEPHETVAFEDISGDPRDNTALDEELTDIETRAIIQVTQLPNITDETKDRIYQYVGETDYDHGLYQGSFYKAYGNTYQLDTENSNMIDSTVFNVFSEGDFLRILSNIWVNCPDLPDTSSLDIVMRNSIHGGLVGTKWWLPAGYYGDNYYWQPTDAYLTNAGIQIGGNPTIGSDDTRDTTDSTRFHFIINKPSSDLLTWSWYPVSIYPYQNINNEQVLVNKSRYSTSIAEKKSGVTLSTDGPNDTLIGVNARINWDKRGDTTVIGYNAVGGYLGTTVGSRATGTNCSVTIGVNASSTSEYGVTIGANASSTERTVAIGERASASAYYGVALGPQSSSSHDEGIAIGRRSIASGQYSIAIGAWTEASGQKSVTLGWSSYATGTGSVQLGEGRNDNANTLQFHTYRIIESDGTVPYQRLASNTPQDGYALVYNSSAGKQLWQNVVADIPVIQVTEMPEPDEGMVVQYIGENDGELIKGYWYEAVYDETGDYWYWRQIDVQPKVSNVSYDDLSDKPSINGVTIEGDLDLVDDFNLARVAQTGSYADLTTKPGINGHPLLANTQAVDLQISYNDLIDKPAGPSTVLPDLPQDKDDYDYMLKWDHVEGKLIWIRAIDEQEDLGTLPAVSE